MGSVQVFEKQTMSSLEIAELTSKPHNDVMKAIRKMQPAWQTIAQGNFSLGSYKDANGQQRPCYYLTKTECLYVATKFNDEARAKLVLRWEELERKQRTSISELPDFTNPSEAARAWADQYEMKLIEAKRADAAEQQVCALSKEIETMQPKVNYYDMILNNKSTVLTTQVALDYGLSAKALNKKLQELNVQHKVGNQWILYAPYLSQGYMHSKQIEITHTDGSKSVKCHSEWTQKGRLFLYDILKKNGIVPLIER